MTEDKPDTTRPYDDEIDLIDYVELIIRRRWLIVAITVLASLAGYSGMFMDERKYKVQANLVVVEQSELKEDGEIVEKDLDLTILNTYSAVEEVLNYRSDFGRSSGDSLTMRDFLMQGGSQYSQVVTSLPGIVEWESNEAGVVTFTATHRDSLLAVGLANAYMMALVRSYSDVQERRITETLRYIESQLASVEKGLRVLQDSLLSFRSRHRVLPKDEIEFERVRSELEWLQDKVDARTDAYRGLLNRREELELLRERAAPRFEILSRATLEQVRLTGLAPRQRALIAAGIGFVLGVLIGFTVEFFARNKASGRMESVLKELRRDPILRWLVHWRDREQSKES